MEIWNAKISGTGGCLPGKPISNQELIDKFNIASSDEWIKNNLGIETRHFASEHEATSDIGARAALNAISNANISVNQIERILLCTSTADWPSPPAASKLQKLIGAHCPAEDKNCSCAGFIFGLDHAIRLVATGLRHVLVIGADVKSRFIRNDDFRLLPIFADGAGAVVVSQNNNGSGFIDCILWTRGENYNNIITPAGGSALPASIDTIEKNMHTVTLNVEGKIIFRDAVNGMTELCKEIISKNNLKFSDVDIFIPHQANFQIMKEVADNLQIPIHKLINTIRESGNIVSGTVPLALHKAFENKIISSGKIILMCAVGAGYSGGAALYRVP